MGSRFLPRKTPFRASELRAFGSYFDHGPRLAEPVGDGGNGNLKPAKGKRSAGGLIHLGVFFTGWAFFLGEAPLTPISLEANKKKNNNFAPSWF